MSGWIEINDHPWSQKPINYLNYLVFDGENYGVAYVTKEGQWWDSHSHLAHKWEPSHWMTLPEPPK